MSTSNTTPWAVTPARAEDRAAWERLYRAYGAVAGEDLGAGHLARVWSWIEDPGAQTRCLLLRAGERAEPVGLAHYRLFERPLAGSTGCWLDDLFVEEGQRGRGGAGALLEHLAALATRHGWSTVRWTTGEANPAQALYDRLARRNPVITYDMAPAGARR
ncbi:GNAT family N-acetyltransferase [Kineococcus auxinigenes]|uniref:GNAT family N-acetyltransferase n=1 Tax=unclassified Kineococcus TaxID=2621656 RepID=UPI003D7DAA92